MNSGLTYKGADWVASALVGNIRKLNTMYIVYANSGVEYIDIKPNMTSSDFLSLSGGVWYMRITDKVVSSVSADSSGYSGNVVIFSTIADKTKVVLKENAPAIKSDVSKIIAVAVGYYTSQSDPSSDVIVSASNLTKSGVASPVAWVDNMDIAVSCPISITVV